MGFFFRKSFKLGLFRVNLSKSGVGGSVGVKGARVGLNAKGQTYVNAQRDGVGYRKVIGSQAGSSKTWKWVLLGLVIGFGLVVLLLVTLYIIGSSV